MKSLYQLFSKKHSKDNFKPISLIDFDKFKPNQTELQNAIEYLKQRGNKSEKINKRLLKEFIEIIPLSEALAVMEMVESGTFNEFLDEIKKYAK